MEKKQQSWNINYNSNTIQKDKVSLLLDEIIFKMNEELNGIMSTYYTIKDCDGIIEYVITIYLQFDRYNTAYVEFVKIRKTSLYDEYTIHINRYNKEDVFNVKSFSTLSETITDIIWDDKSSIFVNYLISLKNNDGRTAINKIGFCENEKLAPIQSTSEVS